MQSLLEPLRAAGAKPVHLERVLRTWLAGGELGPRAQVPSSLLPAAALALLPEVEASLWQVAQVVSEHPAADGTARLLLRLADGASVESVLLPREALCISTQVGCAVGCSFCMTGRGGLERQLSAAEMLAQVALARRRRRTRRVVLMGMGEPTHNLEAVLEAVTCLGREGDFGHKQIVFSTVGDPRAFERLARNPVKPALALSLHSTDSERRARLLPRAPRVEPRALVDAAEAYARRTGHPLQIQWTLLAGINDGEDELARLVEWLLGKRVIVNFIPYNLLPDSAFERTPLERARRLVQELHGRGIIAKLRHTVADEVEGACGQLRARSLAPT